MCAREAMDHDDYGTQARLADALQYTDRQLVCSGGRRGSGAQARSFWNLTPSPARPLEGTRRRVTGGGYDERAIEGVCV